MALNTRSSFLMLDEESIELLCFGYARLILAEMNIEIKIDDLATMIVDYTIAMDIQPIFNPNYTNIHLKHVNHNDKNKINIDIPLSSRIVCDFNFSSWQTPSHNSSSVLFRPFLSTLFKIDSALSDTKNDKKHDNHIRGTHTRGMSTSWPAIKTKLIFRIEIKRKNCNYTRINDNYYNRVLEHSWYFQCGLIGIPKTDILNCKSEYDHNGNTNTTNINTHLNYNYNYNYNYNLNHSSNINTNTNTSDNNLYKKKELYLNKLELFYSEKIFHFENKSSLLSSLYICSDNPVLYNKYYNYYHNYNYNCTINRGNYMPRKSKEKEFAKEKEEQKIIQTFNERGMFKNYKFIGISCKKGRDARMVDHSKSIGHPDPINNKKWKQFAVGDCVEIWVERIHKSTIHNNCKGDGAPNSNMKHGWNSSETDDCDYQLYFIKYSHNNKGTADSECESDPCVLKHSAKLDFDKFDYLFAFSSARCDCQNLPWTKPRGFVYEASFMGY